VVTTLVRFFLFAYEAAGAVGIRLSLRPLYGGATSLQSSGESRRENAGVRLVWLFEIEQKSTVGRPNERA
jgi:hypothetical protein